MLKQNDFIKIEFVGKIKDGGVFDSNLPEELKKLNPNFKEDQIKPFILCLGQGMFLKGVEEFLKGKDIGEYEIELSPEKAFGKRNLELIQRIPLKVFHEQKLNPIPGIAFNFDGKIGKVLASSGGRVIVDFNNPLAGKDIIYKIKVLDKVEDINEKVRSLLDFLFRQEFKFEIKDKKLILEVGKEIKQFAELFKDKFKEMLDLELELNEVKEKE